MSFDFRRWSPSLTKFADWLPTQSKVAGELWSRKLNGRDHDQVEGAVAEAVTWDYLTCRVDRVRLADAPGVGGVDFEFATGGETFLVEVTNISVANATASSGMADGDFSSGHYGLLTQRIRTKVRNKFEQARKQTNQPVLVAVTTLHANASCLCVDRCAIEFAMGSPPKITWQFNTEIGEAVGDPYQSTDLKESVFLSPNLVLGADGFPIAHAKFEPISGFLVCGFGLRPKDVIVYGGLNPCAIRPFDVSLLPDIPFCSFKEWPVSKSLGFLWSISKEDERSRKALAAEKRLRAAGLGWLVDKTYADALEEKGAPM